MRRKYIISTFTLLWLALAYGCGSPAPENTPMVEPTDTTAPAKAVWTITPKPSLTQSLIPTFTPTPTLVPRSGLITPDNAGDLVALTRLGSLGAPIGAPRYAPDGKWLAVATTSGVYLYDAATYQNPRLLTEDHCIQLAFSPNGQTVAILTSPEHRIWIRMFSLNDNPAPPDIEILDDTVGRGDLSILDMRFTPDGRQIAVAYGSGRLELWSLADGTLQKTFQGQSIDFSSDGLYLLARMFLQTNPQVFVYDLQTGAQAYAWPGTEGALLPAGQAFVEDGSAVHIYDLTNGKSRHAFSGQFAAVSPDGQTAALFSSKNIRLYRVSDGALLNTLEGNFSDVNAGTLLFSPDGKTIAGLTWDNICCGGVLNKNLSLWRSDGRLLNSYPGKAGYDPAVSSFSFAPDSSALVMNRLQPNDLQIWKTADGSIRTTLNDFTGGVDSLAFLPDGQQLLAISQGAAVYQVATGQLVHSYPSISALKDHALAVRPDGKVVALGDDFWNMEDGQRLPELTAKMVDRNHFPVFGAAFSPDGVLFAAGVFDGKLQIWDFDAQTIFSDQLVCDKYETVYDVSFSPDGQRLAIACNDDVMGLGNSSVSVYPVAANGQRLWELKAKEDFTFTHVAYSPNGKYLAASNAIASLWNADDGQPLVSFDLNGHAHDLAFSPDSKLLAFGMEDGAIELWSVPDGQEVGELPGQARCNTLAFSPDGKILAAGYADGSLQLWGFPPANS